MGVSRSRVLDLEPGQRPAVDEDHHVPPAALPVLLETELAHGQEVVCSRDPRSRAGRTFVGDPPPPPARAGSGPRHVTLRRDSGGNAPVFGSGSGSPADHWRSAPLPTRRPEDARLISTSADRKAAPGSTHVPPGLPLGPLPPGAISWPRDGIRSPAPGVVREETARTSASVRKSPFRVRLPLEITEWDGITLARASAGQVTRRYGRVTSIGYETDGQRGQRILQRGICPEGQRCSMGRRPGQRRKKGQKEPQSPEGATEILARGKCRPGPGAATLPLNAPRRAPGGVVVNLTRRAGS